MSIFAFSAMAKFGWSAFEFGLCLSAFGIGAIISQFFLVRYMVARFALDRLVLIGLFCYALGYIMIGLASHPMLVYAVVPVSCIAGLFGAVMMLSLIHI